MSSTTSVTFAIRQYQMQPGVRISQGKERPTLSYDPSADKVSARTSNVQGGQTTVFEAGSKPLERSESLGKTFVRSNGASRIITPEVLVSRVVTTQALSGADTPLLRRKAAIAYGNSAAVGNAAANSPHVKSDGSA